MNCSRQTNRTLLLLLITLQSLHGQTKQWVREVDRIHLLSKPSSEIILEFAVAEGFHIQSNIPDDRWLIPTTLSLRWPQGFQNDTVVFPPAKMHRLEGTKDILLVYDSIFHVNVPVKILAHTALGAYEVQGTLRYQTCDDLKCYFPRNLDFVFRIKVL